MCPVHADLCCAAHTMLRRAVPRCVLRLPVHLPPTPQSRVRDQLKEGKCFVQGLDKSGRPVVLGKGSAHHKFPTKEVAHTFCTYALDAAVHYGNVMNPEWDGKLTGVFDLRGGEGEGRSRGPRDYERAARGGAVKRMEKV